MGQQAERYKKILVAFLYFIQGIFLGIPGTVVLTYKQIPSYQTLALFSLAYIPFSLKFISAPIVEKYSIRSYGRKKSWVTLSLILASIFLFVSANFTGQQPHTQRTFAYLLTLVIFMISLEDISTDSLAVKQLNSTQLASYLQCIMQSIGGVVGSLVFLELVSQSLSSKLGFNAPLMTVPQFLYFIALLTFLSAIVIHLTYEQKRQDESVSHSLWLVVKQYKFFFHPRYQLCRQGLQFLLYNHGTNYFNATFTVQLIKNNTISKDLLTSFQNFMIIPVFFLVSILRKRWYAIDQVHKRTRYVLFLRILIMMFLFFSEMKNKAVIIFFLAILSLLSNTQFFINSLICNNFSQSKFAGMYVTMMASLTNFGNNTAFHNQMIQYFGTFSTVIFGFFYSFLVVILFGRLQNWIKTGSPHYEVLEQKEIKSQ